MAAYTYPSSYSPALTGTVAAWSAGSAQLRPLRGARPSSGSGPALRLTRRGRVAFVAIGRRVDAGHRCARGRGPNPRTQWPLGPERDHSWAGRRGPGFLGRLWPATHGQIKVLALGNAGH